MNMQNEDSFKLLRECSAGLKTAIASIEELTPYVKDEKLGEILKNSRKEHRELAETVDKMLDEKSCESKEPNPMAKSMSWLKINAEMSFKPTTSQAASLMTDGCDMGVKSIHKYINKYPEASDEIKQAARNISELEERLGRDMRPFL